MVSKVVQLEALGVPFRGQELHVQDDLDPIISVLNSSGLFFPAPPGGLDRFMDAFQPFCQLIKSMLIHTHVDSGCVDHGLFTGDPLIRHYAK